MPIQCVGLLLLFSPVPGIVGFTFRSMCLSPRQLRRVNVLTHSSFNQAVPCGQCMECLKRKQNDYSFIMSRHALSHSKLDLLTLTYRNESIPFSGVFEVFNPESGVVVERSGIFWLKSEYHDDVVQEYYSFSSESGHQLEVPSTFLEGLEEFESVIKKGTYTPSFEVELVYPAKAVFNAKIGSVYKDYDVRAVVTASLRRSDVKDALKVCRILFKRKYGYNAKFTYFEVGEYGEKHHRPHFHMLLFDCPNEFLELFRQYWYDHYGSTDHEPVVARGNDDLTTAYEKVSKYLSKYLCKGSFEKPFVRYKYVERPRRISSKGIASESLPELRRYCLAFDVFGEYDPDQPPISVLSHLDIVASRRYLDYVKDGRSFKVRIPSSIYNKVLSRTYGMDKETRQYLGFSPQGDTSFTFRVSHQRSNLHHALSSYTKKCAETDFGHLVRQASNGLTSGPSSIRFRDAITKIQSAPYSVRIQNSRTLWSELRNFYNRTKDGQ